ncbi:hypothetical protein M0R88_09730 [Halorussus gelatinilyticus]|uniref:Uncharacterized protein n=1 Tax=Halorussus gelatinilyticus TaxID=2937524 RepID=A0A8U0IF38_9EURY|nr:hypothetical protein [Halorussus gelatinilyticus]UPV98811.1 hypothetical protein M0R88_09730 [Halorussus gelatinilyticus]
MQVVGTDCFHCDGKIDRTTEHFEPHHYQPDSDPILQHTFCSGECLREYIPERAN